MSGRQVSALASEAAVRERAQGVRRTGRSGRHRHLGQVGEALRQASQTSEHRQPARGRGRRGPRRLYCNGAYRGLSSAAIHGLFSRVEFRWSLLMRQGGGVVPRRIALVISCMLAAMLGGPLVVARGKY